MFQRVLKAVIGRRALVLSTLAIAAGLAFFGFGGSPLSIEVHAQAGGTRLL